MDDAELAQLLVECNARVSTDRPLEDAFVRLAERLRLAETGEKSALDLLSPYVWSWYTVRVGETQTERYYWMERKSCLSR